MSKTILKCTGVGKSYNDGALNVQVLNHLDFEVAEAESVSIIGSSGSGKSALLHLLGGLDMPSEGKVILMDQDLGGLSQKQLGELRNRYLGFVYQFHHLLPEFSALENVMMPLLIGKMPKAMAEEKAVKMLKKVGLDKRMLHVRANFPAASVSVRRLPVLWLMSRNACWQMNRRGTLTVKMRKMCWT